MDVTPPPGPPPTVPPPPSDARSLTWGMRPMAVAVLSLLVSGGAALVGFRRLWPYPPPDSAVWLVLIVLAAGLAGLWASRRRAPRARKRAIVAIVVVGAAVPLLATSFVPGIAQTPNHRIPGGRTEALSAAPDGNFDLYVMPDGDPSRLVALTDTADVSELWPALDPTGTKVAYTLQRSDGQTEIHVLQLGNGGTVQGDQLVLSGVAGTVSPAAWTPDGTLLVQVMPPRGLSQIETLDLASGDLRTFLRQAGNLAFSPDGSTIAFSAPSPSDPEDWDIWIASANGSHARDEIRTSGDDAYPSWSPDGGTIAFTSWVQGNADVFTASMDGRDLRNLTAGSIDRDTSSGWSGDGHVLFLSDRSHTGGVFQYFMNADGSDVTLALRI